MRSSEQAPAALPERAAVPRAVRWGAGAGAGLTVGIAGFGLAAWWFGSWRTAALGQGFVPIAPSTALVLLGLGGVLLARCLRPGDPRVRRLEPIVAGAAIAVSVAVVAGFTWGWGARWEHWLADTTETVGGIVVGRMSVLTGGSFLAAAVSLGVQGPALVGHRLLRYLGLFLSGGGFLFGVFTALAYATGTPIFYGVGIVPMALPTAVGFAGLNFALLLTGSVEAWRRSLDRDTDAGADPARPNWSRVVGLALVGVGVALGGFLYLRQRQIERRDAIWKELGTIADLKARQVADWRRERRDDALFLMRAPDVARDLGRFLERPESSERREAALAWLNLLKGGDRYEVLAFFDRQLTPRLSTAAAVLRVGPDLEQELTDAARTRALVVGDLHRSVAGSVRMDLVVPVFWPRTPVDQYLPDQPLPSENLAGLILLRLDPRQYLYPLLRSWPVPSATAETLLVRQEGDRVVYLSELRARGQAALTFSRAMSETELAPAQALRGAVGPVEAADYRGVPVLAAFRPIPGTRWIMVAKVDQAEIYALLGGEARVVGIIVTLVLAAAGLASVVYRRHRHAEGLERRRRDLEGLVRERTAAVEAETSVRRRAEAQLRLRAEAEHLLQEIAMSLLAAGLEETDAAITQALRRIAEFVGADSGYLFVFDPAKAELSQTHLWQSADANQPREKLTGLPLSVAPWWVEHIRAGQEMVVPSVAQLPAEAAAEKKIMLARGVRALVDVPMMVQGEAVGFIGLGSEREGHLWHLEDMDLLRILAQVLASALKRRAVETELRRHRERLEDLVAQRTAALHESERRFKVLFEQAQVAIGVARRGRVLFVNPACARLFGYARPDELVDKELVTLVAPAARETVLGHIQQRSAPDAGPAEFETLGLRRDGGEFHLRAAVNRIELADGPATLSFLSDVTERKRVEAALSASEARFRSLFDYSADGILLTIPDGGRILAANQAACRILGRSEAEICQLGRAGVVDMTDPNMQALIAERDRTGWAQGEIRLIRGDGTRFPAEVSSAIFDTNEGRRTSLVIRDITERKRVEAALRESEYFLSRSQQVAQLGSYKFDIVSGNWSGTPELDRIFGIDERFRRDVAGWLSLIVPEQRDELQQYLQEEVVARRGRFEKAYQIVRRTDGQKRWVFGIGELECDSAGTPVRMIGVIQDITDRRQAEGALRESELRFRTLVENAPEAVFVGTILADGGEARFAYANAAALRLFGAARGAELVGKPIADRVPPEGRELFARRVRQTLDQRYSPPLEEIYLRLDGTPVPVEVAAARIDYLGETGAVVFVRDISERKRAEETIREQTFLLESASDAIMVRDLQHRVLYWNRSAENLYGWKAGEVQGRDVPELQGLEPGTVENAFEVVLRTGEWTGEVRQLTKTRQEITVLSRWSLVRDERGRPKSVFVINTDVTERKKLETQLYRAQRLESIGQLASGIAHDLNNILAPLVMVAPLLRMEIKTPETLRLVDILENNTKRGVEVVKQILTFSRGMKAGKGLVPARPLLKEVLNVLDETFPKSIAVQSSIPEDLWMVEGDATQLHQVLMNLCVNARDAMPDGGTLTVAAENVVLDELYVSMSPGAKPGPYTVWLVADTGMGIPPENLDRIFDPFFTTKEPGKGTGLGLSTVVGIVRTHHGFIKVESKVGKGTQFRVYLPAQVGAQAPADPAAAEPPPPGKGETILVVDDEEGVRRLTKKILEQHGYQVLLASEGSEAVVAYAQHVGEVQAVLTDLMMPLMDGATLIRALKQIAPTVRILATTGVTESAHVAAALRLGAREVLRKPYSPNELLRRIRAVLDEPEPKR